MPLATFTQKSAKLGKFISIDVGLFISRCFLCSDIISRLGIFTRKLGRKTRNLGGKKRNLAKNCSKHFSALDNMARPCKTIQNLYKFIRLGFFFGPRHLCWESKEKTPTGWLGTFFCRAEFVGMFLVTAAIGIYSGMALFGSTSRHWSEKVWDVWFCHCECSFKFATIMSFVPAHLHSSMIHFNWCVKFVFTSERFCSQTPDVGNVEYSLFFFERWSNSYMVQLKISRANHQSLGQHNSGREASMLHQPLNGNVSFIDEIQLCAPQESVQHVPFWKP